MQHMLLPMPDAIFRTARPWLQACEACASLQLLFLLGARPQRWSQPRVADRWWVQECSQEGREAGKAGQESCSCRCCSSAPAHTHREALPYFSNQIGQHNHGLSKLVWAPPSLD